MSTQTVEQLKDIIVNALEDLKAKDIVCIDVTEKTSMTDYMIIATGTSARHLRGLVDNAAIDVKKAGFDIKGQEGNASSDWVLMDFTDVIVHVFLEEARNYYDLERLWQGAKPSDEQKG